MKRQVNGKWEVKIEVDPLDESYFAWTITRDGKFIAQTGGFLTEYEAKIKGEEALKEEKEEYR